ncbi:MAG: hypothetical protein FJ315_05140 [SAR202 cluster bacterium]|nr:hypothetical protein [SAR202 cluster bacterium]
MRLPPQPDPEAAEPGAPPPRPAPADAPAVQPELTEPQARAAAIQLLEGIRLELQASAETARSLLTGAVTPAFPDQVERLVQSLEGQIHDLQAELSHLRVLLPEQNWLDASVGELGRAFRSHRAAQPDRDSGPSHHLLLFYAAECGLKHLYLKQKRIPGLGRVGIPVLLREGHNLSLWMREAGLSGVQGMEMTSFRLARGARRQYPIRQAHEAWRYGPSLEREDESRLLSALHNLCDAIQKRL